jgi:hypothetical protein
MPHFLNFFSCFIGSNNTSSTILETEGFYQVERIYLIWIERFYRACLAHQVSRARQACPKTLTGGDGRCRKRQRTEDKTRINLQPGRLGGLMETHQQPPPPVSLLYTVAT